MGKEIRIGDFLKRIKRPLDLEPDKNYKLVTIKMNHKGVVLRGLKKGSLIKSKMYEVKKGDFILSGIDARNGAFGIVPEDLDGAVVTNDFWYFEIDEDIISKKLFLELTATTWFDEICNKGSDGTTQRIRLQKNKFFNQVINLPEEADQQNLLQKIQKYKARSNRLNKEIENQKVLLSQLKQSILQEAIQGKLTAEWRARNPELVSGSKSAAALLENIKAEKAQLVKEKKVKKEKNLPPITEEEIPYKIPENWIWVRLGDITLSNAGKTLHKGENTGEYRDYITTSNLYWNEFKLDNLKKIQIEEKEFKKCQATKGDLLICEGGDVGRSAIWMNDYDICFQNHIHRVRPILEIDIYFVYYFMMYLYYSGGIKEYKKGMGIGNLSGKALKSIKIPFTSCEEQKAIVSKVETLLQKCNVLEQKITESGKHTNRLMQAVLKEAFKARKEENQDSEESIDALFESLNYDYEVAAVVLLTEKHFGYTYGKKFIHKMFSNIEFLERLPVFKELQFKEHAWGMYSPILQKTIDNKKFINYQSLANGKKSLKVNPESVPEITNWIHNKENKTFVNQVNNMLQIYEKPLIDCDMNRIELLNTVLECMVSLETDDFEKIRGKMKKWKMLEGNYKTKADKFKETETLHMIHFIKNLRNIE